MAEAPARRRGDYGFDAPVFPIMLGAAGGVLLVAGAVLALVASRAWALLAAAGIVLLLNAASYAYTTQRGKFAVWAELLDGLHLRGDERLLDLGCGRGAVLLMAAALLPRGRAVGIDLWGARYQSGNSLESAAANAALEGVGDRVDLRTGDLRDLPFLNDGFAVVVSSMAIHNISDPRGRRQAIDEAVRVLAPGGRLLIADVVAPGLYASRLRELGMADIQERGLGWRFMYGNPWVVARLVSAVKPVRR
jgi:ubiquinone/menaquinone biosynthesis C-methylase UbiE